MFWSFLTKLCNSKRKEEKFEHRPETTRWWINISSCIEDEKFKKNSLLALTLDSELLKRIHNYHFISPLTDI